MDEHSSLIGPFISYEEVEVLRILHQEPTSTLGHHRYSTKPLTQKIDLTEKNY
jgi:hypothetical protein